MRVDREDEMLPSPEVERPMDHATVAHAASKLLSEACPSIRYRIRKELRGERAAADPMRVLRNEILLDPAVVQIIESQQPDGWLGHTFHGTGGMEAGVRLLCEKGLEADHPVLQAALAALERASGRLAEGIGKVGVFLDERELGGSQLIRATVFAYAGVESKPFVQEQVQGALKRFKAVVDVRDIEQITDEYRGKRIFRNGVVWPCIYDLRLLALTRSWRTPASVESLARSLQRLVALSPVPDVHARWRSQLVAPASYCMHDFAPEMDAMTDAQWATWFHRMEMLSRLGIVHRVPGLDRQLRALETLLQRNDGFFALPLRHAYFRNWGAYSGLMLERDWRASQRRVSDLTFRSLLIIRYADRGSG